MALMKLRGYQVLNLVSLVVMLVVNFLSNSLPIGGRTTGEISASYPSLFTPAGFTFSIWLIIYLSLIAFGVYQARGLLGSTDHRQNRFLFRIDIWFAVSCLANVMWILFWHHHQIGWSLLMMLLLLFSLSRIYFYLWAGRPIISRKEYYLVHVPFSLYLGWISVATIANVAIFLVSIGWDRFGFSEVFWTVVMIIAATLLAFYFLLFYKDFYFSIVIVWALLGIFSRHFFDENLSHESIELSSGTGILLILVLSLYFRIKAFIRQPVEGSNVS